MRKLLFGRIALTCALVLAVSAGSARAATVLSFDGPGDYTPGTPFTIDVLLTGATDLALYDITVIMSSGAGVAGVDFFFSAAIQAASQYVFGTDGFGFASSATGGSSIAVGDFVLTGNVATVAGLNDRIATLTVQTTANAGPLSFSVDTSSLLLDTDAFPPQSITGFQDILAAPPSAMITAEATTIIPAPGATAVGFIGLMLLGAMRGRTRRAVARE